MLHWLRDSPWMDPESFLPLIRSWYQDLKRNAPPSQNEVDIWSSKKDIKDFLRVWGYPEDEVIMTCVAMGYPSDEFVANEVKSRRVANEQVASFVGFD
jgi:hypothetical protein